MGSDRNYLTTCRKGRLGLKGRDISAPDFLSLVRACVEPSPYTQGFPTLVSTQNQHLTSVGEAHSLTLRCNLSALQAWVICELPGALLV